MITPDAEPIGNNAPYKRVDLARPNRKRTITALEVAEMGGREPDPAIYSKDPVRDVWILKDGQ